MFQHAFENLTRVNLTFNDALNRLQCRLAV